MPLTTYVSGTVLTAASLNDNLAYAVTVPVSTPGGLVCVKAETAFSAVTSITADSVFTSTYTNYKIMVRFTATTQGAVSMQLRAGGVAATSNYNFQRAISSGTVTSPIRYASQSVFTIGDGSGGNFTESTWIEITGPQLAEITNFWASFQQSDGANTLPIIQTWMGNHSTETAYDGIAISIAGGGTMTGTYTIYGYAKTV